MCGIFAILGSNPETLKLLIEGLKRLEYRGYDSAGAGILVRNEDGTFRASCGEEEWKGC